jgi:uncharacterized protein YjbI with pentapeptide repeats
MAFQKIDPYKRDDGTPVAGYLRKIREHFTGKTGEAFRGMSRSALTQMDIINEASVPPASTSSPPIEFKRKFDPFDENHQKKTDARGITHVGLTFSAKVWRDSDFSDSTLFGSKFGEFASIRECVFDDSDMTGAELYSVTAKHNSFRRANMSKMLGAFTSFRGSDFTDAVLDDACLYAADLRQCKWHGVSMKNVRLNNSQEVIPHRVFRVAKYEKYSFDEVSQQTDIPVETLMVLIWAEGIEVRDEKGELVKENFDAKLHHIPVWAFQNFADEQKIT